MTVRYRPLSRTGAPRPADALPLAGGWCWFDRVEVLERGHPPVTMPAADLTERDAQRLSAPRAALAGLGLGKPRLMGILNVTPDSFSDGGTHFDADRAIAHARAMAQAGADIIDVGGESTRPGAAPVPVSEEIRRTAPIIAAIAPALDCPVSIDTRKAEVARAANAAGAALINDVAAFTFDPDLAAFAAARQLPVCVMHAQGTPETMQEDPRYDHVVLDVAGFLEDRVGALAAQGIPRDRIIVDPGIGFGKTRAHNLTLLRNLSVFHGLGCAVLLGASRKRFIGDLTGAPGGAARMPGSLGVALAAVAQGVQILRVHDVADTRAALTMWQASTLADAT